MSRRVDPARIETARRRAAVARLIGAGYGSDRADALVSRWLAELGRSPTRTDWEGFDAWIGQIQGGS